MPNLNRPRIRLRLVVVLGALLLSSSAHLPAAGDGIPWQGWSDAGFVRARSAGSPVLVYLQAAWCGECRRFEAEVLDDPAVAEMVRERFVPIRVDADRRPDLFRRFGWDELPSVSFLLPSGYSLHFQDGDDLVRAGGAAFTAEGFLQYLQLVSGYMPRVAGQMDDYFARRFAQALAGRNVAQGPVNQELADLSANWILRSQDPIHGGMQGAVRKVDGDPVRTALAMAEIGGDEAYLRFARRTLDAMSRSPVRDPLDGSFSWIARSTDWSNAAPERLLRTQADMLDLYLIAARQLDDPWYRQVADELTDVLLERFFVSDPGSFAASVHPASPSGPLGWSWEDLKKLLPKRERLAAALYYGIPPTVGQPRRELRTVRSAAEVAAEIGVGVPEAEALLVSARRTLRAARERRMPTVRDATILAGANATAARVLLEAWAILGRADARPAAEAALTYIDDFLTFEKDGVFHGMEVSPPRVISATLLEDQVRVAEAWLLHYQLAADPESLVRAEARLDFVEKRLPDLRAGGFFDRLVGPTDPGELSVPERRVDQNAVAARVLLHLEGIRPGHPARRQAGKVLASFADEVGSYGPLAIPFGGAVVRYLQEPRRVLVLDAGGETAEDAMRLRQAALAAPGPWTIVIPARLKEDAGFLRGLRIRLTGGTAAYLLERDGNRGPFRTVEELNAGLGSVTEEP